MADPFDTYKLFLVLNGRFFPTYEDFESQVLDLYNQHLSAFPAQYGYRDVISRARREGWLEAQDRGVRVNVKDPAPA